MRRFFTLVCLLCLAIPAGVSISGCTRNPAANYCNLDGISGYGPTVNQVYSITLNPQIGGISLAYGQTQQVQTPQALTCKNSTVTLNSYAYGTTNNQLVDISPSGVICAGTWNRNTGGGIADYTYCNPPNPAPNTGGLPYYTAYITATAASVTSNPVAVHVHPQVTSIALAPLTSGALGAPQQCFSQGQTAQLDAQACYLGPNNTQTLLCAPGSITSSNSACPMPNVPADIVASGTFTALTVGAGGSLTGTLYISGGTITGSTGQTCLVSGFNNGATGATGTVTLTGTNAIAAGTPLLITAGGSGATAPPSQAVLSSGTATCSGTVVLSPVLGAAGQYCNVTNLNNGAQFNNSTQGSFATVTLGGANSIATGTPLALTSGGIMATAAPTTGTLTSGTATCSGTAAISTVMTPVPSCESSIGTLSYSLTTFGGATGVASINPTTNQITAEQPGTAFITASIASTGSQAGYFSTCPPASIAVTLANGSTAGSVTQGVQQNVTTTVLDTQGHTITGLALDYESTNPIDITAGSGGAINTNFPGVASIFAVCQPLTCNPAPINLLGTFGTGLSIASNPVNITTPGTASDFVWFGAPGQSQYFGSIQVLTGEPGANVRLPYVPNSMLMDQGGYSLYFGSAHELMVYSTANNTVSKVDPTVPGVVLAVSPDSTQVLINDQARHLFYLYASSGSVSTTFSGMGNAAAWTQDNKTLFITDNAELNTPASCGSNPPITGHSDTLYVYNASTGWSTYPLPPSPLPPSAIPTCTTQPNNAPVLTVTSQPNVVASIPSQTPAILVPGVGAYLRGASTNAHTWCPAGVVGGTLSYYPQGDTEPVESDVLATTFDGKHILGAQWLSGGSIELSDVGITIPSNTINGIPQPIACPSSTIGTTQTLEPLSITGSVNQVSISSVNADSVNQVITGSEEAIGTQPEISNLAFITYTGSSTGASLPYYLPSTTGGAGTLGYVPLTGSSTITAPLAGAFSPDNTLFFVSTAGDNKIHYISIPPSITPSTPLVDKQQISPNLPACVPVSAGGVDAGCVYNGNGTYVPATEIKVRPRATT